MPGGLRPGPPLIKCVRVYCRDDFGNTACIW